MLIFLPFFRSAIGIRLSRYVRMIQSRTSDAHSFPINFSFYLKSICAATCFEIIAIQLFHNTSSLLVYDRTLLNDEDSSLVVHSEPHP